MAYRYSLVPATCSPSTPKQQQPAQQLTLLSSGSLASWKPSLFTGFSCRLRRLITLLLVLPTVMPTWAQQQSGPAVPPKPYGQVAIASPTAASLGKYADIPVNYHTGIPNVSVPLYTIKEGPLALPIDLSYHAGGIKVQEPASWVGTGWALNAGGVITRSVMDKPDERGTTNATRGHFSDYGYSSYWTEGGASGVYTASGATAPYDYAFANGQYDGEADLYFFNFNGYTGKFFFSDDRTPVIVDGQDLKIEYYYPSNGQASGSSASFNIQGFIITVPSGDKYYFGDTEPPKAGRISPIETTHSSGEDNTVTDNVYSSYYLDKVVAADGVHSISLTYASEQYCYYTTSQAPIVGTGPVGLGTYLHEYSLIKNNIEGVRLAQIAFSTGTVTFTPAAAARTDLGEYLTGGLLDDYVNTRAKALGSISVATTGFCKQYAFSYSYFGGDTSPLASGIQASSTITTDISRLKLDQVVESSCDGTVAINPWRFEYNGSFLPRRLSFAQDHWGFYNGQQTNNLLNTLIPTYYGDSNNAIPLFTGANREADSVATAKGVLTKLTYPTGGSSTFDYQPNDVWVRRQKYTYQQVLSRCVGSLCGATEQVFTIPFSGNPYRITLEYTASPNDTYAGSASVSGDSPSLNLTVSKSGNNYRAEIIVQPAAGPRTYHLYGDIGAGSNESAIVTVYENVPQVIEGNVLAGGLRVRTVTTQAGAGTPAQVTNYRYRDGQGHSTATLYSRPRYVQVVRNDILAEFGTNTFITNPFRSTEGCLGVQNFPGLVPDNGYLASPCGIIPMSTTQGNHLGYDQVSVAQAGNGRTDYYYYSSPKWATYTDVCIRNVNPYVCDPSQPNVPAVPLAYDYNRGQLKYQRVFDQQGQFLRDVQYTYAYDSSKTVTPGYIVKYIAQAMLGSRYYRRAYWKKQATVIETDIADGQSWHTKTVTTYASPYHRQPTTITQYLPTGDSVTTRQRYIFDFPVPACETLLDGTAQFLTRCTSCDSLLAQQLRQAQDETWVHKYTLDNWLCRANARKLYIAYRRATFTNSTNTFQARHDAAKQTADASLAPLLQLQDAFQNELVETNQWRNGKLLTATYTAFGPGVTQSTIMYPAKQFTLPLSVPSLTFTHATVSGNHISRDARYALIPEVTLRYDRGNVVEVRPKTGIVTAYEWGYSNTLPIVKSVGVPYATLQAAYSSVGGDLSALRRVPSLGKALLTTYTYQPLVGLLSQTDPTGRPTSYEYDGLGRLLRTRNEQGNILGQQQYHYAGQ